MMPLRDEVSLILETDTIVHASPATVSRCGVVYMGQPPDLWRSVLDCWLEKVRQRPHTSHPPPTRHTHTPTITCMLPCFIPDFVYRAFGHLTPTLQLGPPVRAYAGKVRATLCSVFPDLLRAYTDSLDADHPAPRHPASTIMTATLRLLDALIEQVRMVCGCLTGWPA